MKIRKTQFVAISLATLAAGAIMISCNSSSESIFPVSQHLAKFVYTIDDLDVSAFKVNTGSGAVTPVTGSPFTAGFSLTNSPCPDLATADPAGKFLIVPDSCNDNIVVYNIDQSSGALSAISGSPFAAGGSNFNVQQPVVDPTGKFLYVPEDSKGLVLGFQIAANGALTPITGSPFTAGGQDEGLAVHPNGKLLYVADSIISGTITVFSINATSGALTPITGSPFAAGTSPKFVSIDPKGKFLFATTPDTKSVLAFTIDAQSGALTALTGSPFAAGTNPQALDVSPNGKYVYVTDLGDPESEPVVPGSVLAFAIDRTTGALSAVPGSPFTGGPNPKRIATDPSGKFVYVTNEDSDNMSVFSVNQQTGALTQITGSPFTTGKGSEGVTITRQ